MKKFSLVSVLTLCLITPFIMTYRLGSGETPFWLFGLIFGLLLSYLAADLLSRVYLKDFLVWALVVIVVGSAYFSAIAVRHKTSPVYQIHDMVLQLEQTVQFFLQGKNPYGQTYFGTPLEQWHYSDIEVNPALYHFVMMPWYLLFSLPFYFFSISFFGFFDGRLPLVFLFTLLLVLAWRLLGKEKEKRRLFLILLAFNPATLGYFLEGRSDFFAFAFLFWSLYLLEKRSFFLAGIPMALAFATKQSIWPIFPFYLAFLWFNSKRNFNLFFKRILSFCFIFSLVVLPFFAWDKKAFLDSTVFYLSGTTENSYPIAGYGWGMVLRELGIIKDKFATYPFFIWQAVFGLPVLFFLFRFLSESPTVSRLIISYGIFTFVFWYFSRYFNNSHLGYLSTVFLTAYFWPDKKLER